MSSIADQVKEADAKGAVFLDVRTDAEVKEEPLTSRPFQHVSVTVNDCAELMARAKELIPDKNGTFFFSVELLCSRNQDDTAQILTLCYLTNTTAPVIVFCRSGRRAGKAKECLEEKGYSKVLNAGGLKDLTYLS